MQQSTLRRLQPQVVVLTFCLILLFVFLSRPGSTAVNRLTISSSLGRDFIKEKGARLLLVQAVFRHGARTPLSTVYWGDTVYSSCKPDYPGPTLVLKDETGRPDSPPILETNSPPLPGNCRMGQLTGFGYNMAVDLGTWLRRRYVLGYGFLPGVMDPRTLSVRTTCIHRAVQTLQGVMAGLYPELKGPVYCNASREEFEFEYGKNVTCPAIGPMLAEIAARMAERDAADPQQPALEGLVRAALGMPPDQYPTFSWVRLHDALAAMKAENVPLPPGVSKELLSIINKQAVRHEVPATGPTPLDDSCLIGKEACKEYIRRAVGPLIWRLADHMEAARYAASSGVQLAGAPSPTTSSARDPAAYTPPRMYMYSGHDTTITPLLVALGAPETAWPPFTANLVFELWERPAAAPAASGVQYDVRVLYNKEVLMLPLSAPGGWIGLDDLSGALLQPYMYTDTEKQQACGASSSSSASSTGPKSQAEVI